MISIARSSASSVTAPLLSEWIQSAGFLVDPVALSFTIYDVSTDAPVLSFGPHTVNLTTDRVSLGHYAAAWTVGSSEALGKHEIRWSCQLVAGGPVLTWHREFDVLAVGSSVVTSGYALLSEMRAEGMTTTKYTDARLQREIAYASKYIDRVCRQWFEPRYLTLPVDGTGHWNLLLEQPIVGIDQIVVGQATEPVDETSYKVYNRHLSGMTSPDDRSSPKVEYYTTNEIPWPQAYAPQFWSGPRTWPRGAQNIAVSGVFGYTEPDGSPSGETPDLIRRACRMLVVRNALPLASSGKWTAINANRIISERTREQTVTLSGPVAGAGWLTGDPEIDTLLEAFLAPMRMGAV